MRWNVMGREFEITILPFSYLENKSSQDRLCEPPTLGLVSEAFLEVKVDDVLDLIEYVYVFLTDTTYALPFINLLEEAA